MPNFFSRLSYSLGNEDWETEHQALLIQPNDRVLCVTGSGDRSLHLLLKECKEIISIDANPIQNHLLRLKIAAMQQFDYDQYISFLGGKPDRHRRARLKKLSQHLHPETSRYWNHKASIIDKGVLYQGAMEKYVQKYMGLAARIVQGKKGVTQLFNFDCLKEQSAFVDKQWDRFLWRKCFEIGMSPKISRIFLRDPGMYAHIDSSISPGRLIYQRMNDSLKRHLAKDNFFVSLCLNGGVALNAMPPHLSEKGTEQIRPRLDRINIQTADLVGYLETCPENSFDAFSLSDVASYIPDDIYRRLLKAVHRTARPGARFCIREFMSRKRIPDSLQAHFHRNHELEKKLEQEDRCFVYKFLVGHVNK